MLRTLSLAALLLVAALAAVFVVLLLADRAAAATDVELRAMYCTVVLKQKIADYDNSKLKIGDIKKDFSEKYWNKMMKEGETKQYQRKMALRRLQHYVYARRNYIDLDSVKIAELRAKEDLAISNRDTIDTIWKCTKSTRNKKNAWTKCYDDSLVGTLNKKLEKCRRPDFLPF